MFHSIPINMRYFSSSPFLLFVLVGLLFGLTPTAQAQQWEITSPNQQIKIAITCDAQGIISYQLFHQNQLVIQPSTLHLAIEGKEGLDQNWIVFHKTTAINNSTWKPVLGELAEIRDHYYEIILQAKNSNGIEMHFQFRAYNEGMAFRYHLPKQENLNYLVVTAEQSSFNLTQDYKAFWIPGDFDSNEYAYNETMLSEIDTRNIDLNNGIGFKGPMTSHRIQSPVMMKSKEGLYLNLFEAAVVNYPVMHLEVNPKTFQITSALVPDALGKMAYVQTQFHTPWRTIMVSKDARDFLKSKLILNLNEPCAITETSWIKPMKYVGIWWEMHVGKSTWDYAGSQNAQNQSGEGHGKHGATTENTMKYIDFAAKHGMDGVLIEGWNVGWEDWFGNWKDKVFDFQTPYPDFDLPILSAYAKSKNVKLIMHHETSGSVTNYERHFHPAFQLMQQYGYPAVKTGYVGRIIPRGEWHDGQYMVNHFHWTVEEAAKYQVLVNSHESHRPTGYHRTYPNYIAAEAARGNEFNAWSVGNPPSHETILPFTRLLGGPMDYTPGIFEIKMSAYAPGKKEQVHTTLAKQLALYVTMYSPLQMAADLPENYEKHLDAFQFIKDVAMDWDQTEILEAEPGDYLTVARKTKGKNEWFLGAITDENPRNTEISLSFLPANKKYKAIIYQDAANAHWESNPKAYEIKTVRVNHKSKLKLQLAAGGGTAIHLVSED